MIPSRRSFLTGLGAALITAPAIVRVSSIMPVKQVVIPQPFSVRAGEQIYSGDLCIIDLNTGLIRRCIGPTASPIAGMALANAKPGQIAPIVTGYVWGSAWANA